MYIETILYVDILSIYMHMYIETILFVVNRCPIHRIYMIY